jgi:hypothetical protein
MGVEEIHEKHGITSFTVMLLVGVLSVSIFSVNSFVMLPAAVVSNQPHQSLLHIPTRKTTVKRDIYLEEQLLTDT